MGLFPSIFQEGLLSGVKTLYRKSEERARHLEETLLDRSLPEWAIDSLQEHTGSTTSCVQLFICKMSPVVWGIQDSAGVYLSSLCHLP